MGSRIASSLAAAAYLAVAGVALADGPQPVPLRVVNRTDATIECAASLAHWYSDTIGTAEPGELIDATFWSDPADGTVALANAKGDRMPVLALWCGFAGRSIATRFDVTFQRRRGMAEPAIALTCTGADLAGRLDCRRGQPE